MVKIAIPDEVEYSRLLVEKVFSPGKLRSIDIRNKNTIEMEKMLTKPAFTGTEVGSSSYIKASPKAFLRTQILTDISYSPNMRNPEGVLPILPEVFQSMDIKAYDILFAKDGGFNVGMVLNDLDNYMLSSGIVRLRFPPESRDYILAVLKDNYFKDQIDIATARASTIRHSKDAWKNAFIPIPNGKHSKKIIAFIGQLARAILRREKEIECKYDSAQNIIETELEGNQKSRVKSIRDESYYGQIHREKRLDVGIYNRDYLEKQYRIADYKHGAIKINGSRFKVKRGQNLQFSAIGKSIYKTTSSPGFYTLIRPQSLSDYGTVDIVEYLGNKNNLQTLSRGDVLLSSEGTIGKFYTIVEKTTNTISNIHALIFYIDGKEDLTESAFLGLFFGYLRDNGILRYLSVGGQGGSLATKYDHILVPKFPIDIKKQIAQFYNHDVLHSYDPGVDFDYQDQKYVQRIGIFQMGKQMMTLKDLLNRLIAEIIEDRGSKPDYSFFNNL